MLKGLYITHMLQLMKLQVDNKIIARQCDRYFSLQKIFNMRLKRFDQGTQKSASFHQQYKL